MSTSGLRRAAPRRSGTERSRAATLALRAVLPVALLGLWQLLASTGAIDTRFLSSPALTATRAWELLEDGTLVENLLVSLRRSVIGFAIGAGLGTLLGLLCGLFKLGEELLDSTIQMLRTVPVFALTSLFIVWFGFGELPKVLIIALACFFPMYINTYAGVRDVDAKLLEMCQTLGVSQLTTIRHALLPGALVASLVGLRYAIAISVLALVVAETINADSGLGYLMANAQAYVQTDTIFTVLVTYCLLGLAGDLIARQLERRMLRWRPAFKGR